MGQPLRILIVDDSESSRELLRGLLTNRSYLLEEAVDADSAMGLLEKSLRDNTPFDLVLCDWNMPGKSGLQLTRELRADLRFRALPIIMITTENQFEQIKTAIASGANNFLTKPYTIQSLFEKLDFVIEKYRVGKG